MENSNFISKFIFFSSLQDEKAEFSGLLSFYVRASDRGSRRRRFRRLGNIFQDFRFSKLVLPNCKHCAAGGRFSGSLWLLFSGITYDIVGAQLKPSADL